MTAGKYIMLWALILEAIVLASLATKIGEWRESYQIDEGLIGTGLVVMGGPLLFGWIAGMLWEDE